MHLWDFLRPIAAFATVVDPYVRIVVFLFALALTIISLLAYSRNKSRRLLIVGFAFALFGLKWLLKVLDIFLSPGYFFSDASENVVELLILAALFFALFYKK